MGKRRYLSRTWVLVLAGALLAPAAARAQRGRTIIFGLPFTGPPPVTLPSVYSPWGYGSYYPGYYGMTGYGGYGYPGAGYSYPYLGFSPYSGYSYSYLTTTPFAPIPTYQPFTGYGFTTGLPAAGAYASAYPSMRDAYYPPLTTYTGPAPSLSRAVTVRQTPYPGLYTTAPPAGASLGSFAPVAYASMVCGCLTYAPVAYNPASYAATAALVLGPPRRRQSNYLAETSAGTAVYAAGTAPRRAEVDLRLPRANARVWFDGVEMRKTGTSRRYFTPRLQAGGRYTYEVRASWREKGDVRQATRDIYLRPGDVLEVDFTRADPKR